MKQTTFGFTVSFQNEDALSQYDSLVRQLKGIKGVVSVAGDPTAVYCDLGVAIDFSDAKEAMRLHKLVAKTVANVPNIQVVGTSTVVSEIFE